MSPAVSDAQRKAMWAASKGKSTLGIPKKVGAEFAAADPGGPLPKTVRGYAGGGSVCDARLESGPGACPPKDKAESGVPSGDLVAKQQFIEDANRNMGMAKGGPVRDPRATRRGYAKGGPVF